MPLDTANKEQLAAITHDQGPLLIVAGAGTGKTRVITERIAWLIVEEKAKVDEVLALTFTEKAAQEMEERVDVLLPYGYVDLWISTFHSFCDKVLKQHALDIGLSPNFKLFDETQAWLLVRQNLDSFDLDYYRPLGNPTKFIQALLKHFSRCKDEGITPEQYCAYAEELKVNSAQRNDLISGLPLDGLEPSEKDEVVASEVLRIKEIAGAYSQYQQLLLENNALDFADLLTYTIRLLKERPLVLQKYRHQFKYIMVDEFQDTNTVQYDLIKLLAAPKNNVTVVGDDDQSIYRFRGSSIKNIMQFKDDYPEAKEIVLTKNYRSHQQILDTSYDFIALNNPNRLEVKLQINKKLESQKGNDGFFEHLHFDHADTEAAGVVQKIIDIRQKNNAKWEDFAILVRAHGTAAPFTQALAAAGVPYQFLALKGLYTKPIIIDILNYFRVLINPFDNAAMLRVLHLPFLSISAHDLGAMSHYAKQKTLSLYDVCRQVSSVNGVQPETIVVVEKIVALIDVQAELMKKELASKVLIRFMFDSEYIAYLKNLAEDVAKDQLNLVQQFFMKIKRLETEQEGVRLSDVVTILNMELDAGDAGSIAFDQEVGPDMVRVMTIHGSKGLEFDYVFVVAMVDRRFPTDERKDPIPLPRSLLPWQEETDNFHLEEERRLFYVAMTRARKGLFLTSANNYGGAREKKLSRFLKELSLEKPALRTGSVVAVAPVEAAPEKERVIYVPRAFSYSSIKRYKSCPYQYYFANILRIPVEGKAALTFGDVMHQVLHQFLQVALTNNEVQQGELFGADVVLPPLDDLLALYETIWRDEWYSTAQQKEAYFEKGKLILQTFWQRFNDDKPVVLMLEQPFTWRLKGHAVRGRIDRVDVVTDGHSTTSGRSLVPAVEIIDYKTGKPKKKTLSTDDRRQLLLYYIVARDVLKLNPVKLSYYYLESGETLSFVPKPKDEEKLTSMLLDAIAGIQAGDYTPSPDQFSCSFCDFKNICDYRKV